METVHKARKDDPALAGSTPLSAVKLAAKGVSSLLALKGGNNEIDEETGLPKGSEQTHYSPASASPMDNTSLNGREIKIILPPKHVASELIEAVWDNACVLFRFYHRPSFIRDLDLLYETDPDDYTNKQYKILPLVYSVMAVGVLFSMDKCEKLGFKDASEGYKYFVAARKLIDIADARDTYAIQSIVMMIIFLQCSARLSTCYSYIGVALRSALRAGLHRKVAYNFNPIELETRKRLFWTIRKMDIYVNAMLGLPRSTSENDFDQELPDEIDDENITEDAYFPQKEGKLSSAGIANAHTRLITILSHIMKHIYPVKQDEQEKKMASSTLYNATHANVNKMEAEIREWLHSLPPELKPGANPPAQYLKANRLLNLALCHVQIVLYRPFIHYCSPKFTGDEKARVSALNCIGVSRRAMYLAHELTSQKLLNGAYWFSIYTIFFSVACLVFYVHENPLDSEAVEIRRDAELGKNALTSLKDSSMSASRTYNLLNTLFEQLNRRTAKMPPPPQPQHQQPSPNPPRRSSISSASQHHRYPSTPASEILDAKSKSSPMSPPAKRHKHVLPSGPLPTSTSSSFGVTATAAADSANGFSYLSNDIGASSKSSSTMTGNTAAADLLNITGSVSTDGARKTESPQLYVPGIMDQVDTQLFGRFLPPYMLQQQQGSDSYEGTSANTNSSTWNGANGASGFEWNGQYGGDALADAPSPAQPARPSAPPPPPQETEGDEGDEEGDLNARRLSLSNLFNGTKDWEALLADHNELSGLNSFMAQ